MKLGFKVSVGVCLTAGLYIAFVLIRLRIKWGEWVQPQQFGFVAICFVVGYMMFLSGKKDASLEKKKKKDSTTHADDKNG